MTPSEGEAMLDLVERLRNWNHGIPKTMIVSEAADAIEALVRAAAQPGMREKPLCNCGASKRDKQHMAWCAELHDYFHPSEGEAMLARAIDLLCGAASGFISGSMPDIDWTITKDKLFKDYRERKAQERAAAQPGKREATIEECAKLIESGSGMADLIDQEELDQQAKYIRALAQQEDKP